MKVVAVDIGNSTTVCGVVNELHAVSERSVVRYTDVSCTGAVADVVVRLAASARGTDQEPVIGISSVVPARSDELIHLLKQRIGGEFVEVDARRVRWMRMRYEPLSSLGTDRLCDLLAARDLYGYPSIVVDFGTATTFNILNDAGDFIGGAIAPGIETMLTALTKSTAQLPGVDITFPTSPVTTNTVDAIRSGVLFYALEGWEGMVRRISTELGTDIKVITTGGLAGIATTKSTLSFVHDPDLLLKGIGIYCRRSGDER